jgi:hypothetical protein
LLISLSALSPEETCCARLLQNRITEFLFVFQLENTQKQLVPSSFEFMATLLTIQILSVLGTVLTNLVAILTFTTDYWTIIVYDLVKVHPVAKWMVIEQTNNSNIYIINNTNETPILSGKHFPLATMVFGFENDLMLYKTHKGLFRQCNYLTEDVRAYMGLPKCRTLKMAYNQYNDLIHGMINPGREFMRKDTLLRQRKHRIVRA